MDWLVTKKSMDERHLKNLLSHVNNNHATTQDEFNLKKEKTRWIQINNWEAFISYMILLSRAAFI